MTKKSKILYYSLLVTNVVCFVLDLIPFPIEISFFRYSFGVSLILIGLLLIVRAVNFKLDSSLFLGVMFLGFGLLHLTMNIGSRFFGLDQNQIWPYYLFAVSIASLITSLYFKDKLQFKLFILFLGFGLITLLFVQHLITKLWLFITLMIVWFILYFVVNIIIFKRRNNTIR